MTMNMKEYEAYLQSLVENRPSTQTKRLRIIKPKNLTRKQFSKTKKQ